MILLCNDSNNVTIATIFMSYLGRNTDQFDIKLCVTYSECASDLRVHFYEQRFGVKSLF